MSRTLLVRRRRRPGDVPISAVPRLTAERDIP
jgi:hypothetical protein